MLDGDFTPDALSSTNNILTTVSTSPVGSASSDKVMNSGSPLPLPEPRNLLADLLEYTSIIVQDIKEPSSLLYPSRCPYHFQK
ncbi:unnamed protein product [Protopolystoma xenopodis]|uniref:Uncharacterized protein n=1 Tax=Protopolystoma xenopodis TaxID=117903 RepID=A0A3S5B091_9PLAT|nr:unnamed protein product [Protopolystoma xenopodis]